MSEKDTVKTKYYTYSGKTYDKPKNTSIEDALQRIIKDRRSPKTCISCGGKLEYKGLGSFECVNCNEEHLSSYGKIRRLLDVNGTMSIQQITEMTDLTKEEIKELIDEGSVKLVSGSISL